MRTTLPLSVATATLIALSCSSGGPEVCAGSESIPQQTVGVGEDANVTAICFEDPSGGTLTYSASSADASIVETFIRGSVWIRGVSPGQTTVTATATNEADQSESVEFQAFVPNQPPEGSIADMTLPVGVDPMIDLAMAYTDPDGQELTYTASSSSSSVATATVAGSVLTIRTTGEGLATVTVTASDGEAEHTDMFDVTAKPTLVADDFASAASLDDWVLSDSATAVIEDSRLVLTAVNDGFWGLATHDLGGQAEGFTVDVALRPTETAQAGFWVFTGHERFGFYQFAIGNDDLGGNLGEVDWLFAWFDAEANNGQGGLFVNTDWSIGTSDDISDDVTSIVTLSLDDQGLQVSLNGVELIAPRTDAFLLNTAVGISAGTRPKGTASGSTIARTDWIALGAEDFTEVEGAPQAYLRPDFGGLKIKRIQQHK